MSMGKPKPEIFGLAMSRFGIRPESCLFIDDHPVNVDAAQALDLPAVLFADAARLQADLVSHGLLPA